MDEPRRDAHTPPAGRHGTGHRTEAGRTHCIRFAVLGQLRATRADRTLHIGSPQQQAMLAVLLLRSGRAASMSELIDGVWGEEPPYSAAAMMRTYAWRLRRSLDESPTQPQILVSVGDGYRLVLDPGDVDAVRAEQLAGQAAGHRAAGRPAEAAARIGQALALWHGEALAGVPGPHAEQQRGRLEEVRLTLLEQHFDLLIGQGSPLLAVPELGALVSAHPLRESFHALYIRALQHAGRQADALAAYHRLRTQLADALGVEPSRELRALYQRLLADDASSTPAAGPEAPDRASVDSTAETGRRSSPRMPDGGEGTSARHGAAVSPGSVDQAAALSMTGLPGSVGGDAPGSPAPAAAATPSAAAGGIFVGSPPVPAQLPAGTVDFTGRSPALDQLTRALATDHGDAPPVVVITGMGGVGKSALAVRAAHGVSARFPDGQLYADMRGNRHDPTDAGVVLTSFITALGVAAQFVPESLDDRAGLLRSLLNGRRVLILLDDVRDATQISPLLPGAASCAVLITSRSRLWGLPTSARVDLAAFEADEAVSLLERIVGPARVAEDQEAARELVHSCGLLPLAVRIAASRLASRPAWGARSLAVRLADERRRMAELRAGDLTVASVFEMGYRQLSEAQARTFRLLAAVCDAEIGTPAASAVLGLDEEDAEEQLEALVDLSLLDTSGPGRYRLHDLLRVYGQQQATREERLSALDRLLDFLLGTAAGAFQRVVPGDAVATTLSPTRSAGVRFADVRTARAWAAAESEAAFSVVLVAARESRVAEVAAPSAGPQAATSAPLLRVAVDLLIALTAFGPYVQREQLVRAAMAVAEAAEELADHRTVGRARFLCGNIAVQGAGLVVARQHLRVAETHCRENGDAPILCQILNDLGLVALLQHDHEEAVDRLDEAVRLARELGQRSGALVTTVNAALARLRCGRVEEARRACESALAELRAAADHQGVAYALSVLGLCMHELGRYDEAVARYTECLSVCRAMELHSREAQAHYRLADTLRAMGRPAEAVAAAGQAVARCADGRSERDHGHALVALGRALADLGRTAEAAARLGEAAAVFTRLELPDALHATALREELPV
ncbi:BTAD domain-containing putative transcriptional regulator [Streptomyces sp. 2231.1]|uniref:AfsR/SARP family transcriptional regulator n=1 Tax=Streptomyces sp. 2231.1 TaxID=1855347 RepID=UPI00210B78FF|nr:BTAD domain-containing putative transcriptional regulator [Streptomyces sp. 2231.1]